MNILSVSQLQTQTVHQDSRAQFQSERDTNIDSNKASFAKALDEARKSNSSEPEKTEERKPTDENKVAKNESRPESDKEIDDSEKDAKTENREKNSKIAEKDGKNADENEDKSAGLGSSEEVAARIQNLNNMIQKNELSDSESVSENGNIALEDTIEIDSKMISWLSSSRVDDSNETMSSEDFAKMIDAAVEFIPGFESESEKLESAQNLAANDPQFFLENSATELSDINAAGTVKTELNLDDTRKNLASKETDEKKKGAKLSVHDLRTRHLVDDAADKNAAKIASDKVVQKSAEKKEINLSMQKQADGAMQMTMELAARAQENITSSSAQVAGASGSDFQQMLSNAVQENAPEFVKAGNIVLKDNNQGSINLILRPEGLGNVKISLNLDDKNLSAQITVQTKEAMDAFRESIPSLKQAFAESGFETGSFDLNFSNNQNQQGFAQGDGSQNQQNSAIYAQKTYGDFVTTGTLSAENTPDSYGDGAYGINIVA